MRTTPTSPATPAQAFFDRHLAEMRAERGASDQDQTPWWQRPATKTSLFLPFLLGCIALPAWLYVLFSLFR